MAIGMGGYIGAGIVLGAQKIVGKAVIAARVGIAFIELLFGELKINIEHFGGFCAQGEWCNCFAERYAVADLLASTDLPTLVSAKRRGVWTTWSCELNGLYVLRFLIVL